METKPDKILILLFKKNSNKDIEFLCLKQTENIDSYWQFISGNINAYETFSDALSREITERFGELETIEIIPTEKIFKFIDQRGNVCREVLFLIGINDLDIALNSKLSEYKWLNYFSALSILKFDRHKEALAVAYTKILEKTS